VLNLFYKNQCNANNRYLQTGLSELKSYCKINICLQLEVAVIVWSVIPAIPDHIISMTDYRDLSCQHPSVQRIVIRFGYICLLSFL